MKDTLLRKNASPLICVVAIIGCLLAWHGLASQPISSVSIKGFFVGERMKFTEIVDFWRNRIRKVGASTAYQEMVNAGQGLSNNQDHSLAHSFGEALFREKGLEGFSVCGVDFSYGCYDQFIGTAITQFGPSAMNTLHTKCLEQSKGDLFGCTHSIGHGVAGFYGYSVDALNASLAVCDTFGPDKGCADGVFMEYNFRGMAISELEQHPIPRSFVEADAFEPCVSIDMRYRNSCVFELPWWWINSLLHKDRQSLNNAYREAGMFCRKIGNPSELETCFEGIGYYAPQSASLDTSVTRALCTFASDVPRDRRDCLSSAAARLQEEQQSNFSHSCVLLGLTGGDLTYCEDYVHATGDSIGINESAF